MGPGDFASDLTLVKFDIVDPTHRWRLDPEPQCHPWHEIVGIRSGVYRVRIAGESWRGEPGVVFVYPAGTTHQIDGTITGDTELYILQWRGVAPGAPLVARRIEDGDGRLCTALAWLGELCDRRPRPQLAIDGLLAALVTECCNDESALVLPTVVRRVLHHMRSHCDHAFTLQELAELGHVGRPHLIRLFKQHLGHTPMAELRRIRAEAARRLLQHTDLPSHRVAAQVGLGSSAQLTRLLKRHYNRGITAMRHGERAPG